MWDTAGSERFKSLIPTYLKNANAIILTFDITNKASFHSLGNWLNEIKDKIPENTFIIVAGNKLDLESKRYKK
jgi:small GTP-binding protein